MAAITTKEKNGNIVVGEEDKAWSHAMLLSTSAALPMVLNTVIELDVLEIIKRAGPSAQLSTPEIVAQLPTQNPQAVSTLDRLLRLLASHSVLTCSLRTQPDGRVERLYGLAPVCKFLTKDQDGHSLAPHSFFFHDKEVIPYWYHVKDAILEGGTPFNRMYGMPPYEYYPSNPRLSKVFNNAMVDMSTIVMKKILENYKGFEGISTLVDLGGNRGASLNMITSTYPNIKGINFDLPNVIDGAITEYPGVTHVGGDMFVSLPKADAIFIKSVFHNWDDEHCIKFMKNCYAALPDHGKVIACELYLPVIPETEDSARMAYHCDVFMWVSPNGKERTQPEYEALGKAAGFQDFRVASSAYDFKLMEFLKRN